MEEITSSGKLFQWRITRGKKENLNISVLGIDDWNCKLHNDRVCGLNED